MMNKDLCILLVKPLKTRRQGIRWWRKWRYP